jgi:hypothetical protein
METKKEKFKLFNHILMENGRYSQGRVYLLWSVFAYYITLGALMISEIRKADIEMSNFRIIVDALEYAMTLFGGYVFGGKFISAYLAIKGTPTAKQDNPDAPTEDIG